MAEKQSAEYANGYDNGLEDGIAYARRNDLPLGLTVEQAIERAAGVLATYRDKPLYVHEAVAALILDALDWPYGNGQRPSDMKPKPELSTGATAVENAGQQRG